jgi:tripartite-type tricarboxylate transporter receptor subunit TctC
MTGTMRAWRGIAALLLVLVCTAAWPQPWPARPVKLIVPFPAGSSPDLVARILAEPLAAALGQPFLVENRPGAGGNLGTGLVAKAPPDGYTFGLSIPGPLAVNTVLYRDLPYDPFTDLAPVSLVAFSPNVLVVDPRLGAGTLAEFIAAARAQPGRLNYGSVGNGSASHLTMELLKARAGLDIVHVPYPGSAQAAAAVASGDIAAAFIVPATAMPLAQAGRVRIVAATSGGRSAVLPAVPTVAEQGFPGFESIAWNAVVAPAKTPRPIVERLSAELVRIVRTQAVREKLQAIYFQPVGTAPAGLATLMREERDRWAPVIRNTGARVD